MKEEENEKTADQMRFNVQRTMYTSHSMNVDRSGDCDAYQIGIEMACAVQSSEKSRKT